MLMSFLRLRRLSWLGVLALSFVLSLALTVANPVSAQSKEFASGSHDFVVELADKAVKSLAAPDIDTAERRLRFGKLMHDYFAFKAIAKWVLGRHWKRATEAERAEYLRLFERLMVVVYADRFAKYSGETLEVTRAEVRDEKDALVHSRIVKTDGAKPIDVAWRVRRKDDTFKIVDVMVEGLSMGLTQQKEFSSVIRQKGEGIEGLLKELRKRLAENG